MKNKKAFTLVELIGVITILGIITLIAVPTIKKMNSESKEELYEIQIKNIESGLKNWAIDNSKILPKNEGEGITITLGQLKMGGYIDVEIKNPKNNKCFGNDMTLEVARYQKNYIYTVNDTTGTETTDCNSYKKPYIILNGTAITYVEINENYVDSGVIAKDAMGNDITSNVVTTITGGGSTVDTTKIGNKYTITYTVTADGETASINRTVIVRDTIQPILTIPENAIIGKSVNSFDIMEGVSATDNSGENVEISAKSNISFGIPGDYTITYTAKDSSGNVATKNRTFSIVSNVFVNGIMKSENECITSSDSLCSSGTKINVQVNDSKNYDFYVLSDTGSKLTLIMASNLYEEGNADPNVAWLSYEDYEAAGGKIWQELRNENSYGPITALRALKDRTKDWGNIDEYSYELKYGPAYIYDETWNETIIEGIYSDEYVQNVRARLPKLSDISSFITGEEDLGNKAVLSWLGEGLIDTGDNNTNGYWLSDASSSPDLAWNVRDYGTGIIAYINDVSMTWEATTNGIRPVIEISK